MFPQLKRYETYVHLKALKNVYRNIICNDQNIETTQMSFDWRANETYPGDGICPAVNKLNADTPAHGWILKTLC